MFSIEMIWISYVCFINKYFNTHGQRGKAENVAYFVCVKNSGMVIKIET